MFQLLSADLPTTPQKAPAQTSTPFMRLWNGVSKSMAPIAIADYLKMYANSVGLEPIVFHGITPSRTGIYYNYTLPLAAYQVYMQGFKQITDPRSAPPNSFWLNGQIVNIIKTTPATEVNLDAVLSATAASTPIANQYQVNTSSWGTFTVPTNIFVDGIELTQSDTNSPGTFQVLSNAINIYTSAPLPVGSVVVHINQNVPPTPNSVVATYDLPSFAHVADLAGRSYFRASNYLSPNEYDFVSDDTQSISLFAPLAMFTGLEVFTKMDVLNAIAKDVTSISF